jgi:hypothetical protein
MQPYAGEMDVGPIREPRTSERPRDPLEGFECPAMATHTYYGAYM